MNIENNIRFTHVFYEKEVINYELGKMLLEKYKDLPQTEIENHNNIFELRTKENKDFPTMKHYLILGIRKTLRHVPNNKTSDYLVPFTSSGCSAMCLYCYLVCNYNKCSYLRIFVNRDEILNNLIKVNNKSEDELVFEIGSNSDLILENLITGNLVWTIENFIKNTKKGILTFPTKFAEVDSILNIEHQNRIIPRMSVNPQEIITKVELGTSNLKDRINSINKLVEHGYPTGILIAPVILVDNYKELYKELVITLANNLSAEAKKSIFFEVIFMTYSYVHDKINKDAFPKAINLYNKDLMTSRGRGKYCYKKTTKDDASLFIKDLLNQYFKDNEIKYIV